MENYRLINQDTQIGNISNDEIKVSNESTLIISGIQNGNLFINKGSTIIIHGTVNGNIVNEGICKIFGVIHGDLIKQGGQFHIDKGALINPDDSL